MPTFKSINNRDELPNWQDASKFNSKEKVVTLEGKQYALIAKKQHSLGACEWITRLFLALVATLPFFIGLAFKCVRRMWSEVISGKETIRFGLLLENKPRPIESDSETDTEIVSDKEDSQEPIQTQPSLVVENKVKVELPPPTECKPIELVIDLTVANIFSFLGLLDQNSKAQPHVTPQDFLNRYLQTFGAHTQGTLQVDTSKMHLKCDQKAANAPSPEKLKAWDEAITSSLLLSHRRTISVNNSHIPLQYFFTTVEETNGEVYLHFVFRNEKFRVKINNIETPHAQIFVKFIKEFLPLCYLIKMDLDLHFGHRYAELKNKESVLFVPEFYFSKEKTSQELFGAYRNNRNFTRASYQDFQKAEQHQKDREEGLIIVKSNRGAVLEISPFRNVSLYQDVSNGSRTLTIYPQATHISLNSDVYKKLSEIEMPTIHTRISTPFSSEASPFRFFELSSASRYLEFDTSNTKTSDWQNLKGIQDRVVTTLNKRKESYDEKEMKFKKTSSTAGFLKDIIASLEGVHCDKNEELLSYKSALTTEFKRQKEKLNADLQFEIAVIGELLLFMEKTPLPALKYYEFNSLDLITEEKREQWVNSADLSGVLISPAVDIVETATEFNIPYDSLSQKQLIVIDPEHKLLVFGIHPQKSEGWMYRFLSLVGLNVNMQSTTFYSSVLFGQFNIQKKK